MKSPIAVAVLTVLLFACSTQKTEKIFDFKCENKNPSFAANIQYNREQGKYKLISIEEKNGDEKIMGKIYDAFEKNEEVLVKVTEDLDVDAGEIFLNLKSGRMVTKNEGGSKEVYNCKRI